MIKVKTSFRLPEEDLNWLRDYSESQGRTISSQLLLLIRRLRAEVEQGDRA